jgi:CRP-like cAMP-binding protein
VRHASGGRRAGSLRTLTSERAVQNSILSSIPNREFESLSAHLEPVALDWHVALHEASRPIEYGYFPESGVVSLVVAFSDGRTVEVCTVGREGFIGAPLAGGLKKSPHRALVEVAGHGYRIRARALENQLPLAPEFRKLLTRYTLVQAMQLAQTAACNRLHGLEQRMARWLLMTQDRVDTPTLPTTHEQLAALLGTDRPSVSVVARSLQACGILESSRGEVTILNRRTLRERSCECYEAIQRYYAELEAG